MRKSYAEKLKDPRWQKVRLKILERDDWKCLLCDATEKTLHVHHQEYHGRNPWEDSPEHLGTLCEDCHDLAHDKNFAGVAYCIDDENRRYACLRVPAKPYGSEGYEHSKICPAGVEGCASGSGGSFCGGWDGAEEIKGVTYVLCRWTRLL